MNFEVINGFRVTINDDPFPSKDVGKTNPELDQFQFECLPAGKTMTIAMDTAANMRLVGAIKNRLYRNHQGRLYRISVKSDRVVIRRTL